MRDGALLANAGHFDVEIDVRGSDGLAARSVARYARTPTSTSSPTAGGCCCSPKDAW